ncbi:Isthmin-1 [Cyphomyrmex costatus]|uniref:Isthmin-1 n=1 Tax=Cyphomyrmex costatus TaxID=456900 RepID=A0A151IFT0_9HYME|nr:Isthmin-1 [Cyphomyrmex costatus]
MFLNSPFSVFQAQVSTKAGDVECKENCTKLHNDNSTTSVPFKEKAGNKHRQRTNSSRSRPRNRPTHRPRKSGKGTRRKTDRVPPVVKIPESSFYEEGRERESVNVWNHKNKNDDVMDDIPHSGIFDNYPFHGGLEAVLVKLKEALENNTAENVSNSNVSNSNIAIDDMSSFDDEDRCQKWLDNREKIENAFPGSVADLPACPCLYPNTIFYDNQIWDEKQKKKFRWRDVSHDKDRLEIYKPGAIYCVQTLASQQSESAIVQHCCYDENRKLLTRGSGAGTPYIVSPDISPLLHDKIDLLPWRLCKGDFTRYNEVRIPNNGNDCEINPDDEEYQHQVESAKDY